MSRNVSEEILSLLELVNAGLAAGDKQRIAPEDVQQFIVGASGAASSIEFEVTADQCAVVVAVEDFNADTATAGANTVSRSASGALVSIAQVAEWVQGADVFYVFPPGMAKFTFTGNALAGRTFKARAIGYLLPHRALRRLGRISTKVLS